MYVYFLDQDICTDLMDSLGEISATKTQGYGCLLKLLSPPELLQTIIVPGVFNCTHISLLTSNRAWVRGMSDILYLTSITGEILHQITNSFDSACSSGSHTVNGECEFIYIDRDYNINKLTKDMKTCSVFIKKIKDSIWNPQCVYCSPSTGDLLVGMRTDNLDIGKVTRYNQCGQLTQTIQNDGAGLELYYKPIFITENNNGDVVVSDFDSMSSYYESGAVVVTERCGKYRFSYTGHPSGSGIRPTGICTDALSNILFCDSRTRELHILNSDGQFLSGYRALPSHLRLSSVSYDADTYCLWVGLDSEIYVFKYISLQDSLTGN